MSESTVADARQNMIPRVAELLEARQMHNANATNCGSHKPVNHRSGHTGSSTIAQEWLLSFGLAAEAESPLPAKSDGPVLTRAAGQKCAPFRPFALLPSIVSFWLEAVAKRTALFRYNAPYVGCGREFLAIQRATSIINAMRFVGAVCLRDRYADVFP